MSTRQRASVGRGFTLTELIVVITIIVILTAVAVPAFRSTLASSESSMAETQLRLAFATGREAALHSDSGSDSALMFQFEPGGRTSMIACEYIGTFRDKSGSRDVSGRYPDRDVFVPISAFDPIQLPRGWMVRGFVPAGLLDLGGAGGRDWYDGNRYDNKVRSWVFPETGFFDALRADDGAERQSFLVRFDGKTGAVLVGDPRECLVLLPRATASDRTRAPFDQYRFDRDADLAGLVQHALQRDDWKGISGSGIDQISRLLGDVSGDTVLCHTVEQVVLYKESDLAESMQARIDKATGCLYKDAVKPEYVAKLDTDRLNRWLEGDTNNDGQWIEQGDTPVARIYTLQRYTASLQPVPLLNLPDIARDFGQGGAS
ncbi:MAG: prepilin-type N-terminal cleavage/methylation domain-containing protein [Phycisphaerales bacterium]|nr:prepilin-type N-terminal cleavage/methylation domain-containing protein [Phycisphaerales bacterium]